MIDAGSSGSRAHLYQFNIQTIADSTNNIQSKKIVNLKPIQIGKSALKVTPGLVFTCFRLLLILKSPRFEQ
jgi:Golgi nucleoside diphosphatase